ncbi:MAG TPA: HlyD family efflux transporter periplasmic adaptor subunit [Bryobacteraceae bacterium]|nr:HlyD family efflux transporter periplasmic adaptor subunit [Bryobacteraceae bacterium]
MRGKWALFGGIVILLAVAAGALSVWKREKPVVVTPAAAAPTPAGPAAGAELSLPGKVEAREVVGVQAPSNGTIAEYLVVVGEEVFEGQLIARISNLALQGAQERAKELADKAQERVNVLESQLLAGRLDASRGQAESARIQDGYTRAERLARRQELLHSQGATPRLTYEKAMKEFETAKAEYESATGMAKVASIRVESLTKEIESAKKILEDRNAELEEADSNLQATQVHAPVDGIILERKGEAGTEIRLGEDNIFRIATDLGQLQVVVEPEKSVLAKLHPGMEALVILAEFASEPLRAEISRVEEGKALVLFGSPDPSIKPGITAQVRVRLP